MPFNYDRNNFDSAARRWSASYVGDKLKRLSRNRGGSIVDLMNKVDPTDESTLVISIGGLGGQTLNQIKKKYIEKVRPCPVGQEKVLFLALDTSKQDLDSINESKFDTGYLNGGEIENILPDTLPEALTKMVALAKSDPNMPQNKWIDQGIPDAEQITNAGARGRRQISRLALSYNNCYTSLLNKLSNKLNQLKRNARVVTHAGSSASNIKVILVSGISGGTGSGSIIDITYMLYLAAANIGGTRLDIDAIIYSPEVQDNVPGVNPDNLKRNFAACMKEIDAYFKAENSGEIYRFPCDRFPDGKLTTDNAGTVVGEKKSIFRSVTIVQGYDAGGSVLDISIPIDNVANYVVNACSNIAPQTDAGNPVQLQDAVFNNEFGNVGTAVNNEIFGVNANLPTGTRPNLPRDAHYAYRAIGYHEVTFPVEEIMTIVANSTIHALHKMYQKYPSISIDGNVLNENIGSYILESIGLDEIGGIFTVGNNSSAVTNISNMTSSNLTHKDIKDLTLNFEGHNISGFSYDSTWIDSLCKTIFEWLNNQLKDNGPYASLRLSSEITDILDEWLKESSKASLKTQLQNDLEAAQQKMTKYKNNIANTGPIILGAKAKNDLTQNVNGFKQSSRENDIIRWKIYVFESAFKALRNFREKLVEQNNKVFDRYVGAFRAICEVVSKDSTTITNTHFSNHTFSAALLDVSELGKTDSRLYELVEHYLTPERMAKLSTSIIKSMLGESDAWTSTGGSFDAVKKMKDAFKAHFGEFQENALQKFLVIKYTGEEYRGRNTNPVSVDTILSVLDQYLTDPVNHPNPWFDFEIYCAATYGVRPLHKAAEDIFKEAMSVGYCAYKDSSIQGLGLGNYPSYKLICLMDKTPAINDIIEGKFDPNEPALPEYIQWKNISAVAYKQGQVARADISSVICIHVIYGLPLYMFKGLKFSQDKYFNSITGGQPADAGMHMDSSTEAPWKEFPPIVNNDALKFMQGAAAVHQSDYGAEKRIMDNVKETADICIDNGMMKLDHPQNKYFLYHIDDIMQDTDKERCHNLLLDNYREQVQKACDNINIDDVNVDDLDNSLNKALDGLLTPENMHDRMTNAGYALASRKIHEDDCYMGTYEIDRGDYEVMNDACKGGLYKIIRRSTKSRLLTKETAELCKSINAELDSIRKEILDEKVRSFGNIAEQMKIKKAVKDTEEKLKYFVKALYCGAVVINNDSDRRRVSLRVIGDVNLYGSEISGKEYRYRGAEAIERSNLLYAVFVSSFLKLNENNDGWWKNFKKKVNEIFEDCDADECGSNYQSTAAVLKPAQTNRTYYPIDTIQLENSINAINDMAADDYTFDNFGETLLTVDDIPKFRDNGFDRSLGSQLIRFYYLLKEIEENYEI